MCCLLEKVPIRSLFHSKMGHHFYKFGNPLHVGAVHDALDNIGLFQSVCGQFKLIKVFVVVVNCNLWKPSAFFHKPLKIHRSQWSTEKPLIQWQWLDGKKPLKNHWYQWFKFDKIIDDNGWIVKILEKTIGYNGFFSKTIDHSIVLKKWPSLWSK